MVKWNNNVLDYFWWNFSCESQNKRNNNEVMIYNYGLDHTKLSKQFVFFLYSSSEYNDI